MTILPGFHAAGEVTADDRARIAFGKSGVVPGGKYAKYVNDEGEILLTPVVSIPKRELLVWENDELRASLLRGLAQASAGDARPLPWVTADLDPDSE